MAQVLARLLAATALSAALFAVAPGCAQPVRVDFDAQHDFGAYRIWAWLPPGRAAAAGSGAVTPELDAALRGAVCCTGLRSPADIACRAAPARDGETSWVDATSVPRAACRNRW